jgi:hypothetical protein
MKRALERTAFEMSRELEYFSGKELTAQIGHAPPFWPAAILRELVDNALDACEVTNGLPEIEVTVADDRITVTDNGPGLPPAVLEKSLDYLVRVSDKAHYVSPTRGQMGNALKVVWAAPFVAIGKGAAEVVARGQRHRIEVTLDRIVQRPAIRHTKEPALVKNGTSVSVEWQNSTRLLTKPEAAYFYKPPTAEELLAGFAAFNPHATFTLNGVCLARTEEKWKKWRPDNPTSAHWYSAETLRDLIAAYIARERNGGRVKTASLGSSWRNSAGCRAPRSRRPWRLIGRENA